MVKANSIIARKNIQAFITNNFNYEEWLINHGETLPHTFESVRPALISSFESYLKGDNRLGKVSNNTLFYEWMSGLPSYFEADDIFLGCEAAINSLGDILEQTPGERSKYNEMEAEKTLCTLIYRELTR